jgi:hypothetical protein
LTRKTVFVANPSEMTGLVVSGGGGSTSTSNAPASQAGPCGRAVPRWSVAGQPGPVPVSSAALPASSAIVSVWPPLS